MSTAPVIDRPAFRLALSQKEAAFALGMSVDHFEKHVRHALPVVISGTKRVYPVQAIQDWLDRESLVGGRRVA